MNGFLAAIFLGLLIIGVAVSAEGSPTATLPKEIQGAQEALAGWLNDFRDKTQGQVEKQLGPSSDKATWEFRGRQELLLRYKTSETGTLLLYFLGNQVIKATLQLLSE
jgi:hypothetical protein